MKENGEAVDKVEVTRSVPFLQSYTEVHLVSTIYRRASTINEMWYYETIVWEYDRNTRKRGELLETYNSGHSMGIALEHHNKLVVDLLKKSWLGKEE